MKHSLDDLYALLASLEERADSIDEQMAVLVGEGESIAQLILDTEGVINEMERKRDGELPSSRAVPLMRLTG
ncbi:MAG: hypothetical protein MK081_13370 [Flavobacteriales bacterium]|nr:hypothetical protein [Flavobacteriales bacterium]